MNKEICKKENLQHWIDLWESNENKERNQQEFWDNRADFFNDKVFTDDKIHSNIVELLKEKGMLDKKMNVLDIGCGPGKHTLPMAKEVGSITALDISKNMLDHLKENMENTGIVNIKPLKSNWKELNIMEMKWENTYDLVFASMSPAIFNYETLHKMLITGKKYYYLSSFVQRKDLIGDEIREYINQKYDLHTEKTEKIYYVFNILWILGYTPELQYLHRKWEDEMSLEEAYNHYKENVSSQVVLSYEDQAVIKEIIRKKSNNGKVIEKIDVTQGILTWKVLKDKRRRDQGKG